MKNKNTTIKKDSIEINSNNKANNLEPNWITGFIDAEGCFYVYLGKRKDRKSGWKIQPCFQIKLHIKDKNLLLRIKSYFGEIGTIVINNNYNFVVYKIYSLDQNIRTIIPHFDKYPLITQKQGDFFIWKKIINLINNKEHLNEKGLIKVVSLKTNLNKGLSKELKLYFPDIIKVEKPKVSLPTNIDKNWIAGFFSGEGCFSVGIYKSNSHKIGYGILLQIIFTQHLRDEILFDSIKKTLGCGNIIKSLTKNIIKLNISKFEDIYYKMIPLFKEYDIEGIKALDFQDFCVVAELINNKVHLTLEGLEEIQKMKNKMNKSRVYTL